MFIFKNRLVNFHAVHTQQEWWKIKEFGGGANSNGRLLKNEVLAPIRAKKGGSKNPPDTHGSMIPALKLETELEHSVTQELFPNLHELSRFTI